MKFDFTGAAEAKSGGSALTPGIKNAKFNGVEFKTIEGKDGTEYNTLSLKLNIEGHGDYVQNFFEPESDERAEGQWGKMASQLDHFQIVVREIMEAVDPNVVEDLKKLGGSFKKIVNSIKEFTDPYIGTDVQVKLLPQKNGYASMPSYVARITRSGALAIATWIIGKELTLSESELKRIKSATTAAPTDMKKATEAQEVVEGMKDDDDDLPF